MIADSRTTLIKDSTRYRKPGLLVVFALTVPDLVAYAEMFFGEDRRHVA